MKNTMLNEAIYTVLTTKYKKEAPEAFKRVRDAGYEIYKEDGRFNVRSRETGKVIYISEEKQDYRRKKDGSWGYITYRNIYLGYGRYTYYNSKMDLVNALDTPENKVWHDILRDRNYVDFGLKSKAVQLYKQKIQSKRRYMKACDEYIQNYQEQIKRLQKQIAQQERLKVEYASDIDNAKVEMGLK